MQRGITGNEHHPTDWERQREQLSAYLDGELEPAERTALESHLATCPACQAELDDLRALRSMLRAMPAPTLPRSFLLPEEGAVPQPISVRRAVSPAAARSRGRGPRLAEWVGALVASLGLALLLGSAFASHGGISTSSALAPGTGSSSNAQTTNGTPNATAPTANQSHTPSTTYGEATAPADTPSTATATPAPIYGPNRNGNGGGSATPADTVPPILPIGGAGLFIGGAVAVVVGRAAKRRPA